MNRGLLLSGLLAGALMGCGVGDDIGTLTQGVEAPNTFMDLIPGLSAPLGLTVTKANCMETKPTASLSMLDAQTAEITLAYPAGSSDWSYAPLFGSAKPLEDQVWTIYHPDEPGLIVGNAIAVSAVLTSRDGTRSLTIANTGTVTAVTANSVSFAFAAPPLAGTPVTMTLRRDADDQFSVDVDISALAVTAMHTVQRLKNNCLVGGAVDSTYTYKVPGSEDMEPPAENPPPGENPQNPSEDMTGDGSAPPPPTEETHEDMTGDGSEEALPPTEETYEEMTGYGYEEALPPTEETYEEMTGYGYEEALPPTEETYEEMTGYGYEEALPPTEETYEEMTGYGYEEALPADMSYSYYG